MSVPAHTKVESLDDRVTRLERVVVLLSIALEQRGLSDDSIQEIGELSRKMQGIAKTTT